MAKKPPNSSQRLARWCYPKSSEAADTAGADTAAALTENGNASRAAIQELTKAYQELATKNVNKLTAAMRALATVKSPQSLSTHSSG